jgi:hypothetical protein
LKFKKWQQEWIKKASDQPGVAEVLKRRFRASLSAIPKAFLGDVEEVERLQAELKTLRRDSV